MDDSLPITPTQSNFLNNLNNNNNNNNLDNNNTEIINNNNIDSNNSSYNIDNNNNNNSSSNIDNNNSSNNSIDNIENNSLENNINDTANSDNNNNNNNSNNSSNSNKSSFRSSLSSFLTSYYSRGSNNNTSSSSTATPTANNTSNTSNTTYLGSVRGVVGSSLSYVTSLPLPSYNSLPSFNIPIISYLSSSILPISYSKNNSNNNTPPNIVQNPSSNNNSKTTIPIPINNNNKTQPQSIPQKSNNKSNINNNNHNDITISNMSPNSFNSISIESSKMPITSNLGTEEQFQDILRRLELPAHKFHLSSLDSFIDNIKNDNNLSIEDISSSVQAYISTTLPMLMHVCASVPFHHPDSSKNSKVIESKLPPISTLQGKQIHEVEIIIYEFMEQYITTKLYRRIFSSAEGIQKDTNLCEHISKFQNITPSNLDINDNIISTQFLEQIQEELLRMTAYKSPREKLMCIKKSFKLLFQLLSKTSEIVGADLLLPMVIFCLIKSNLPFLISNLQFISLFRDPTLIESETNYFLVTMFTATSFIENMTFESLTDARDPSLPPPSPPSSSSSSSSSFPPINEDLLNNNNNQKDKQGIENIKEEIKINSNNDNNSNNNKSNSNSNNIQQQHEGIKPNIEKENLINENDKLSKSIVSNNNIIPQPTNTNLTALDEEKRKLYKFYHSKPEDISVREIKQLLNEYNQLVDKLYLIEKNNK